ncbi:hypothetical protein EST38_g4184 [Candolleomyces aberdarensis]|uniref:ubiquitinyl hydrolase 1 n=1 Tax=Candolleomyces aberdarensis TaxID=2316362 RepID=A0A4Q2DNN6_9AGAR|nr:hypothetical protein EST38_g4184 [Candolleomyces aberdarensis]
MSSLTLTDPSQEIDSYMAEQGEADIPPFITPTPQPETSSAQTMDPIEKVAFVEREKARKMEAGETWYLVSKRWWKRWRSACTGEIDKDGPSVAEQEVGPVDNSLLLDEAGGLKISLTEGIDVEFVPEEIWNVFATWYGTSPHPLARRVTTRGLFAKTTYLELHPPSIKVLRLASDAPTNLALGPPYPVIQVSIGDSVKDLCDKVANAVKPNATLHIPYRVWKVEHSPEDWRTLEFPTEKLKDLQPEIVEESLMRLEDKGVENGDLYIVEFKQSNGWLVDPDSLKKPLLAIEAPQPVFDSNNSFFNRFPAVAPSTSLTKTTTDFFSGFGSKATASFSKSYNKPLEPGKLGLGNMGNTCFMNSALQCLAHTQELSEYFLSGVFVSELNRDNPLGMRGAIAEAFGSLLERIWATSGPSTSYSPREFKQQLARFAPQFSGYQQHDSQELVAFLLDGLHEDLNRVLKKPYVEKPDWEGGGDEELVKLAKQSWDGYMMRNDSVIVDLFQGQYQSTLVCPECSKVSITFDPFMYLTLPLPVNKKWKHTIYYVPWDSDRPHVTVPVEVHRDATFKELRILLGRYMDAVPENLITMEIFQHRFYKTLDDSVPLADVNDNDTVVCFELPCNARQGRMHKKGPDDPFILPVFLCDTKPPAITRPAYGMTRNQPAYFGYPTVVVVDRQQATSVESIYEAVIHRLERWTRNASDLYVWEAPSEEETITEIPAPTSTYPTMESVTEITPDGDVREVQEPSYPTMESVTEITPDGDDREVQEPAPAEEEDIPDDKEMVLDADDAARIDPRLVGPKPDIFDLRLQTNYKEFAGSYSSYSQSKWEQWDNRKFEAKKKGTEVLLQHNDAIFCEFDENMKAYFFGETRIYEQSNWEDWGEFIHPEYEEAKKAGAAKHKKGLTLEDCLEEFVREEQLGEEDLWYCPQCKKHQQATKKFDLWKAPDILVVHLKRFSNNRILRDKIDSFVDFPIEDFDLGDKVGERAVAKRLLEQGIEMEELKTVQLDEPLVYDLFAVDEHMGGLGGGHYRAYSSNHLTGKWYHFDDAYVTPAQPRDAVNANAYLLFYRRRSNHPLGGKTHEKVEEHKAKEPEDVPELEAADAGDGHLPTPPDEHYNKARSIVGGTLQQWGDTRSHMPSPPADDPPDFEEAQSDPLVSDSYDNIFPYTHDGYAFSDHFRKSSPTSSNEAEVDPDLDRDHDMWDPNYTTSLNLDLDNDDNGWGAGSAQDSPSFSEPSASVGSPLEDDLYDDNDDDRVGDVPDENLDEKDESKTT